MGFLKRLFSGSIRSRKNKRQRVDKGQEHVAHVRRREEEDDAEATLTRLLRSSSAKWEVLSQSDLLAPPNPGSLSRASTPPTSVSDANTLRAPSPAYSTASAPLLSYNVTVHERTVHTPALPTTPRRRSPKKRSPHRRRSSLPLPSQFNESITKRGSVMGTPRSTMYIDNGMTPNEKGVFTKLRRDPSIRTIVGIYDAHGCVSDELLCAPSPARPVASSRIPVLKTPAKVSEPTASQTSVRASSVEPIELPPSSEFSSESESESDAYEGIAAETEVHEDADVTVDAETQEDLPIELIGRIQVQRTGSTLRQLLGVSDEPVASSGADTSEGDLSWAERMLANEQVGDANAFSAFLKEASKGEGTPMSKFSLGSKGESPGGITAPASPEPVHPTELSTSTPVPSKTLPTNDSPPVPPASEVFAFLLAPRRTKASAPPLTTPIASSSALTPVVPERTTNGASPYPPRVKNYYLPPLPPVQSFVRQGPTGRPFAAATTAAAPSHKGRGRSNSAGPADVLSDNGGWTAEHRRAVTDTAVSSSLASASSTAAPALVEAQPSRIPLVLPVRPLRRSGSLGAAPLLSPPPVPPKDHPVRPSPRSAGPLADMKLQPTRSLAPSGLKSEAWKRASVLSTFTDASTPIEDAEVCVGVKAGVARARALPLTPTVSLGQQQQRRKGADKENMRAGKELSEEAPRTPARPRSAMAFYSRWEKEAERR